MPRASAPSTSSPVRALPAHERQSPVQRLESVGAFFADPLDLRLDLVSHLGPYVLLCLFANLLGDCSRAASSGRAGSLGHSGTVPKNPNHRSVVHIEPPGDLPLGEPRAASANAIGVSIFGQLHCPPAGAPQHFGDGSPPGGNPGCRPRTMCAANSVISADPHSPSARVCRRQHLPGCTETPVGIGIRGPRISAALRDGFQVSGKV